MMKGMGRMPMRIVPNVSNRSRRIRIVGMRVGAMSSMICIMIIMRSMRHGMGVVGNVRLLLVLLV